MSDENAGVTEGGQVDGGEGAGNEKIEAPVTEAKKPAAAPSAFAFDGNDDGDDGDNDGGAEGDKAATEAAKWRDEMAGGDAKLRKQLDRFKDPASVARALMDLRAERLKPAPKLVPPKGANAEQLAEWRKSNGLPADIAEYGFKAEEGDEITAQVYDMIGGALLEKNAPKEVGEAIAAVYPKIVELQEQLQAGADKAAYEALVEAAREDFGKDWKKEIGLGANFLREQLGAENAEALMALRLEDGSRLGNNYNLLRVFTKMARELGGDDLISEVEAPGSVSVDARLDELYGLKGKDDARYMSDAVQQEIFRLEGVKESRKARSSRRAA